MLTAVPALPIAVHTALAPSAKNAPAKLPNTLPQATGKPASNPSQALPLLTVSSNSYGEDAKPVSFEGMLHHALDQAEEPAPIPTPRMTKATSPDPKPVAQGRAIGNVFPLAVHQDNTDPLPAVLSFALPVPAPVAPQVPVTPSSPSSTSNKDQTQGDRSAAPTPSVEVQQPASAGEEAFSVRLNPHAESSAPLTLEASKKQAPAAEQTNSSASSAATEKATFGPPITTVAAAPVTDLKPVPTHSPAPVTSIESIESPAPVTTPATPVRDLALHLPGAHGVEIRMTEKSGEVHVEVRTGDQQFTQDLRDNLHELVSGLERKGLSAQISYGTANPSEHLFTRAGETTSSNDSPSDGQGGAFARDQEQKQQQRQSEQKFDDRSPKARAAEWSETFNFNLEAPGASRLNTTRDQ